MDRKVLSNFKRYLYDYCLKYYEISKNGTNKDKEQYKKLLTIYKKVNSFKNINELNNYINSSKDGLIVFLFNNYSDLERIRKELYNLATKYYNTYNKSRNKSNAERYKIIKKIYEDIISLSYTKHLDYYNNLENKSTSSIEMQVISDVMGIISSLNSKKEHPYNETLALNIKSLNMSNERIKKVLPVLLSKRSVSLRSEGIAIEYFDSVKINTLDNAIVKDMHENKRLNDWEILYLIKLDEEMIKDPYLFSSLPISLLDKKSLLLYKKYMPHLDEIVLNSIGLYNDARRINNKFVSGKASEIELNRLFKFLSYYVSSVSAIDNLFNYEELLKYLTTKNILDYYETTFMLKYLGYKKSKSENIKDVNIVFTSCDNNGYLLKGKTLGLQFKGLITLNKKYVMASSFKNNKFTEQLTPVSMFKPYIYEASSTIATLYHELRHVMQYRDYIQNKENDMSYSYAVNQIAGEYDSGYYSKNYSQCPTEIDANIYSYKETSKLIQKYSPSALAVINTRMRANAFSDLEKFNYRYNKRNKRMISEKYEKDLIDEFFRTNPKELNNITLFKQFYYSNGSKKSLTEILSNVIITHDYHYKYIVGALIQGDNVSKQEFAIKNTNQKYRIIKNILVMIEKVNKRLYSALEIYREGSSVIDYYSLLNYNILVDIKVGKIFKNLWNNILVSYPSVIKEIIKYDNNIVTSVNNSIKEFELYKNELQKVTNVNFERKVRL